ncbi:putative phosphoprotein [Sekira virus]|uniref:Phosphoprotein n=1 Tax=Sekira virus TaxID=2776145 RepID=A0AAD1NH22_9MONO|nr:putative phosphoprotein [Sekira virus]BCL64176.1 putative phosphoprotein [Sekira virus]
MEHISQLLKAGGRSATEASSQANALLQEASSVLETTTSAQYSEMAPSPPKRRTLPDRKRKGESKDPKKPRKSQTTPKTKKTKRGRYTPSTPPQLSPEFSPPPASEAASPAQTVAEVPVAPPSDSPIPSKTPSPTISPQSRRALIESIQNRGQSREVPIASPILPVPPAPPSTPEGPRMPPPMELEFQVLGEEEDNLSLSSDDSCEDPEPTPAKITMAILYKELKKTRLRTESSGRKMERLRQAVNTMRGSITKLAEMVQNEALSKNNIISQINAIKAELYDVKGATSAGTRVQTSQVMTVHGQPSTSTAAPVPAPSKPQAPRGVPTLGLGISHITL